MTAFARKVSALAGVPEEQLERLAGGDLSEVLLVPRPDGERVVAKGGSSPGVEAEMLRALAAAGVPAPLVEGEFESVLLLRHVEHDGLFNARAWADIGARLAQLHANIGPSYGWVADYNLGTVHLDNREGQDWPTFWAEQRLISVARLLDRPLRARIEALARRLGDALPRSPPPALLHGDLWTGNILVRDGRLAALIDPACYHGDAEVDLAMITLFDAPPESFAGAYGALAPGWEQRRTIYQLFPALVHLRLFGGSYSALVDRLLSSAGA
ncbi:MAG: fructosamine kinase family protein [Sphingosinicella sp.]|uniref:fructosamine kinase family protein n=1 Tax=Sphingosinicella sp. TaxID=1917971 RepID=UPI0040380088